MSSPQSSGYIGTSPDVTGQASSTLYSPAVTGGVTRSVEAKLRDTVSIDDVGVTQVTINDNGVHIVTPPRRYGQIIVTGNAFSTGAAYFDVLDGGTKKLYGDASLFSVNTGVATGTTFTDTHFTISPADNGNIYLENRLGTPIKISYVLLAMHDI